MLVFSQSLPQDGDVQEVQQEVMEVEDNTAQHIAEAQPAVIQTVTKS